MTNKISLTGDKVQVDVLIFKEGKYFIAFIPALNLSSHSSDKKKALKSLDGAISLFMDHWKGNGKLHEKLSSLGWELQKDKRFIPSKNNIQIPFSLLGKKHSVTPLQIPAYC